MLLLSLHIFMVVQSYNLRRSLLEKDQVKYDALVDDAKNGAGVADPAIRWLNFIDAEKQLVVEDAGCVPVFQSGGAMIISPKISSPEFHSAGVDSYRHIVIK